jgi:fluoride ion exporter CrcB/FEX
MLGLHLHTVLHLVAWAQVRHPRRQMSAHARPPASPVAAARQVGTLVRIYLGLLLGGNCGKADWAPCVTSGGTLPGGAVFVDLPANILGSFLMGLFVATNTVELHLRHTLRQTAALAALPAGHSLQVRGCTRCGAHACTSARMARSPRRRAGTCAATSNHTMCACPPPRTSQARARRISTATLPAPQNHQALHTGIRTGLCGSLTTFASWVHQMVVMVVGGPFQPLGTYSLLGVCGLGAHSRLGCMHGSAARAGCWFSCGCMSQAWQRQQQLASRGPTPGVAWSQAISGCLPLLGCSSAPSWRCRPWCWASTPP